jgi:hypothetical protein
MRSASSSSFARSGTSDFWLFGYLNEALQKNLFDEPDELLPPISQILRESDRETVDFVFQEWMIRLQTRQAFRKSTIMLSGPEKDITDSRVIVKVLKNRPKSLLDRKCFMCTSFLSKSAALSRQRI